MTLEAFILSVLTAFAMHNKADDLSCLAEAVYFEARNQSETGQRAVAEVIRNRVMSKKFKNTYCDVVREDRGSKPHDCQFSYYCDGKPEQFDDEYAYAIAVKISAETILNMHDPILDKKTYYYFAHDLVRPKWASKLEKVAVVEDHTFLKER
jgi:spore germination cell wall hydrolase CwlJ-like protein